MKYCYNEQAIPVAFTPGAAGLNVMRPWGEGLIFVNFRIVSAATNLCGLVAKCTFPARVSFIDQTLDKHELRMGRVRSGGYGRRAKDH